MDAAQLPGCLPAPLVVRLLELGHEREVEFHAGRGEWFCALEWARLLGHRGRREQALDVLAPYVAADWWPAVRARAELLEGWGRADEAIAVSRPVADAGDRAALNFFARLLARHGRSREAFVLLRPGIRDWLLAECLVDVAETAGLDEEAAALLQARIAAPGNDDPGCDDVRTEPFDAVGLLATIRERQDRIEEAIALLRTRETTSVNGRDQLADLLARHDRITELRTYAADEFHGHAVRRLAETLEERGDVDGAIAAYRTFGTEPDRLWHVTVPLSELLVRHGRADEAIEAVRTLADQSGAEDWVVHTLCTLYSDHGRPQDGLAYLDALKARNGGQEDWDFFRMRLPLMAECGRLDEALDQARAHPDGDTWFAVWTLSDALAAAGRPEEAADVLDQHPGPLLAERLIDLGRVDDAVRVLQVPTPGPIPATYSADPPF